MNKSKKIIISGGGTGGHVFPAISIANALKSKNPEIEILFVGADGKMEMEKVPSAGYKIIGLPVRGFQRKITFKNISFFWKLYKSMCKAKKIIKEFKPDAVIGVGGFASGPVLKVASRKKIPTLIQEQNSYAGVTNKILGKRVDKICVAYEEMERFFPKDKIIVTGNPIRQDFLEGINKKAEAFMHFDLQGNKKTLLIVGGSLGAKTINDSVFKGIEKLIENRIQVIWQTGKQFYDIAKQEVARYNTKDIRVYEFITKMDLAYSIADVVVSRAGAITISELSLIQKPAILVPSPNVAEDHQTKNAMALIKNDAAMMVEDKEARDFLIDQALDLIKDEFRLTVFKENISKMGFKNSAEIIADEIIKLIEK
ncbi:MAG: undecaprenyldiphospho-muramoylpentapeptide beta-N-acetylglucosaminyltransferase [Bacteroidota bacterium]